MAIKKYQKLYYVYFCPPWNTYSKMLLLKIVRFFFWTYTHITSREKLENKGRGRTEIVNVVSGVYVLRRIFFFVKSGEHNRSSFHSTLEIFFSLLQVLLPTYLSNTIFQAVKRGQIVTFVHTLVQISVWQKKVC